jgi:hypothetical protein
MRGATKFVVGSNKVRLKGAAAVMDGRQFLSTTVERSIPIAAVRQKGKLPCPA